MFLGPWKTAVLLGLLTIPIAGRAEEPAIPEPPRDTSAERSGIDEFLWERGATPRGMLSVSWAYASDGTESDTRGVRVGFGMVGGDERDYPWGGLWLAFRENGTRDVTAAGISAVPVATLGRRFGLGILCDLGVARRRLRDRTEFAGLLGAGTEGVLRIFRRWDLVAAAGAVYHTPSDVEFQARVGIRFHHPKIPILGGGP